MQLPNLALFLFVLASASAAIVNPPTWTQITDQTGDVPAAVWNGGSAYDEKRDVFYIFGGLNATSGNTPPFQDFPTSDLFSFNPMTREWTKLSQDCDYQPSERAEAVSWVAKNGDLFIAGGRGPFRRGVDSTKSDTWSYDPDCNEWNVYPQTDDHRKIANRSTEAVVDKKGSPIVFSGTKSTLPSYINRAGAIHTGVATFKAQGFKGWSNVDNDSPPSATPKGRNYHAIGYDKHSDDLYIYGGYTSDTTSGQTPPTVFSDHNYLDDLWKFDVKQGEWTKYIFDTSSFPGKRDNVKMVVDRVNSRLWLIGGANSSGYVFNDLWTFKPSGQSGSWLKVLDDRAAGNAPGAVGAFWFVREVSNAYQFFRFGGATADQGVSTATNALWKLTIPFNAIQ